MASEEPALILDEDALPPVLPQRGRARSGAFMSDDDELTHDIATLNASLEGKPLPPPTETEASRRDNGAGVAGSKQPARGQLSKKTIKIMTSLDKATGLPPELAETADRPRTETEEEAAERELAEQERKKRAAEAAAKADGASSGSSATSVAGAQSSAAAGSTGSGGSGAKKSGSAGGGARTRKPEDKDYDICIKLLLLGDGGVGKTSLMLRYSEDKFSTSLLSTAGVDYKSQYLEIEGKRVKCQIWDTAGQQRFHVITQAYYKGAHGIVLVYDVSDPHEESFNNVRYWMENIQKHANPHTLKMLVGNKIDVKGKKIESARGRALAEEYGMKFFETSAKDGTNVTEAFHSLAREVVGKMIALDSAGNGGAGTVTHLRDRKEKDCVVQ